MADKELDIVRDYNNLKIEYEKLKEHTETIENDYLNIFRENRNLKKEIKDLKLLLEAKVERFNNDKN